MGVPKKIRTKTVKSTPNSYSKQVSTKNKTKTYSYRSSGTAPNGMPAKEKSESTLHKKKGKKLKTKRSTSTTTRSASKTAGMYNYRSGEYVRPATNYKNISTAEKLKVTPKKTKSVSKISNVTVKDSKYDYWGQKTTSASSKSVYKSTPRKTVNKRVQLVNGKKTRRKTVTRKKK